MKSSPDEQKHRMSDFKDALKRSGVKLTHQRMVIFQEVAGMENHSDAESIHGAVREKLPMVSLDTVYRTLWLLEDLCLIRILGALGLPGRRGGLLPATRAAFPIDEARTATGAFRKHGSRNRRRTRGSQNPAYRELPEGRSCLWRGSR